MEDHVYDEYKNICKIFYDFYIEKNKNEKNKIFINKIIPLFDGMSLEDIKIKLNQIQKYLRGYKGITLGNDVKNEVFNELYGYSCEGYVYSPYMSSKIIYGNGIAISNPDTSIIQLNTAIITTSANPFHFGHLDLYNKAKEIFPDVKVVIAQNSNKDKSYNLKPHMDCYHIPYEIIEDITIADYCKNKDIKYIVRGIRNGVDAEYELKLDFVNKEINPNIQTIFIPTNDTYSNISSSTIRELLKYHKYDIVKMFMNEKAMWRYLEDVMGEYIKADK